MGYATIGQVRDATLLSTAEVSDAHLAAFLAQADAYIDAYTGKNWAGSEAEYPLVQRWSILLAAIQSFERLHKAEERVAQLRVEERELRNVLGRKIGLAKTG